MELAQIIKGLECCTSDRGTRCCIGCPYAFREDTEDCSGQLMKDALAKLKEICHE